MAKVSNIGERLEWKYPLDEGERHLDVQFT